MVKSLEKMNGEEVRSKKFDKAILAVGSCEYHGDHLPYGCDTFASFRIAEEVAKRVDNLLLLPPIPYGMSEHYAMFPMTMSLKHGTLIAILKDILYSLWKNDVKKVIIINGHDGNIAPIEVATREFKVEHPDMKIAVLEAWWVTAGKLLPKGTFEVWDGLGHGGEAETSLVMYLVPEYVKMENAKKHVQIPKMPKNLDVKWIFSELTPHGVSGDPTKATKEKGEAMFKVLVDAVVKFIEEMESRDWSLM